MTDNLHNATKTLFMLVSELEPRIKPLKSWFDQVVVTLDKWHRAEGNQGVKRMKDILQSTFSIITGEPISKPLAFVSTNKEGVPTLTVPLVERCKSITLDAKLLSAVLSLVRVTDLYEGNPTDLVINNQLKVISQSRMPLSAKRIMSEFKDFVSNWLKSCNHPSVGAMKRRLHPFSEESHKSNVRWEWYRYWSTKSGPNGELTLNSHKDLISLHECVVSNGETLFSAISRFSAEIARFSVAGGAVNQNYFFPISPDDYMEYLGCGPKPQNEAYDQGQLSSIPHNKYAGKISFKPEKSGKVRLIAMPDYYTQVVMKPVHNWLMNVLKCFDADCTFDQRAAIPKIVKWQNEGKQISSFDQSSCTDLFPVDCQLMCLSEAFDKRFTSAMKTVMVDREWQVKMPSGYYKTVRWSVGQPMGMYASWPLMAVAHHFLVQFSAWRSSGKPRVITPFKDYVICGDDIVIASKSVSDSYYKVVSLLGMKINLSKSHVTGGKTGLSPVSEFAKIIIWRGQPLNAIKPKLVLKAVQDWKHVVTLVQDLRLGVWRVRKDFVSKVIRLLHPSKTKVLETLLTIPTEFGGFGFRTSVPLRKVIVDGFDTEHIHPWVLYLANIIRQQMILLGSKLPANASRLLEEVGSEAFRNHPAYRFLSEAQMRASRLCQAYGPDQIPSARTLAIQLMSDGVGHYDQMLFKDADLGSPWPVWEADPSKEKLLSKRLMWDRILNRPTTIPRNAKVSFSSLGKDLSEATINLIEQTMIVAKARVE